MNSPAPIRDSLPLIEGEDMARRKLQQKGDLYAQGDCWRLRWREYDVEGGSHWSKPVIVGPAPGNSNMRPLTKREARRDAWNNFLSKLDQNNWTPRSVATVAQFVERKFRPDHLELKRKNTRIHYDHLLRNHILPAIGELKLREVKREHIQRLASQVIAKGLSVQTAHHVVKIASAVFSMAEDLEWSQGNRLAGSGCRKWSESFERT